MRVELESVSKRFDARKVLSDIILYIPPGELLVLLGPSGSGKSTLLSILAGLLEPDAGVIRLDWNVVNDPGIRIPASQRSVGMVFQDLALWPHMTVERHLRFVAPRADPKPILEQLEISHLAGAKPGTLSGGEAQRVAIARALATKPKLFLLDEPLGPLDRRLKLKMLSLVADMHRRFGTTTIHVTHDYEEAFRIADRVALLVGGRLVQVGSPSEVYERPSESQAAELSGPASFLEATGTGEGVVSSALGTHRLVQGAAAHGHVQIVLRPEHVRLSDGDGQGTIQECRPSGPAWDVTVKVQDAQLHARSDKRFEFGARVVVQLPELIWTVKS